MGGAIVVPCRKVMARSRPAVYGWRPRPGNIMAGLFLCLRSSRY